ncbi:MAG: P1 family peptidase [candidate division KSB1 bacterium]|nr:P1 family peptidase [candidate division KSB1 bacterium]
MLNLLEEALGLRLGHIHDEAARTGCTVILPERAAIAGVDVRGSAPGSREIEALKPVRLVSEIHGVLLTGGSAFGLDASGGVQKYLEERGIGFDVGVAKVPIVPTAVIFDLAVGDAKTRPTAEMAYRACVQASATETRQGLVGAGCGATVGKIRGYEHCMLGGFGAASWQSEKLAVVALVVVNALGDVIDPQSGKIIAGAKNDDGSFLNTQAYLKAHPASSFKIWGNTTLAVVATNAAFKKEAMTKIAEMAQDGLARAIQPAHTPFDGDMVFSLSVGEENADVMAIGTIAAELVAQAIVQAVTVSNKLA